ncbi:hypothetical protein COY28_07025 [Candidatus Woesearchaeota archaeon CG_4_10_14_0_2_um_filter_57_5]|nr:MAG: hypothetical protein AUJ68_04965 [Candidatus Woesearchaeota archaeon CG1_02_57_44]PIZ48701.1 MAG: hypothetical protein COY28_07025 [Candidatus Woesearchaeota archaeon CG_4_10_14_0_2_um_filter_57_5]
MARLKGAPLAISGAIIAAFGYFVQLKTGTMKLIIFELIGVVMLLVGLFRLRGERAAASQQKQAREHARAQQLQAERARHQAQQHPLVSSHPQQAPQQARQAPAQQHNTQQTPATAQAHLSQSVHQATQHPLPVHQSAQRPAQRNAAQPDQRQPAPGHARVRTGHCPICHGILYPGATRCGSCGVTFHQPYKGI